jgi:phosphatidylserine synthase
MSRREMSHYIGVGLALIMVLFFLAPIPIVLFKALSIPSTVALLMVFEVMFTVFFVGSCPYTWETMVMISLAYGAMIWSFSSNWISIE